MQIRELYDALVKAYSEENLNQISSGIISLYRGRDMRKLRQIHATVFDGSQGTDIQESRIFTRIISLYHPDRQEQIYKYLNELLSVNDLDGMKKLDHVLDVQQMDIDGGSEAGGDMDVDYGDIWDFAAEGYSYINDEDYEEGPFDAYEEMIMDHGFISAVKRKIYGHLHVEFPVYLLADMEIIEMSEYEIENLDGVEYCTYARIIDLAGNNLTEVTQLAQLMRLEEIFLQNNHISYIDGLNELPFLRILDLSHNDVNDLTALFEVESLEFLNIIGNRVPEWQLEKLSRQGVIIVA